MDCNTARLYLQLGGTDADELRQHLGECTACTHLAQDIRRLDDHLGRAMRAVEAPRELKEQLLQRLAADHGALQRGRAATVLRWTGLGAAAAVLLAVGVVYMIYNRPRPVLAGETIVHSFNILRPDQYDSNAQLKLLGGKGGAPSFVNYAFLCGEPSLAILPGTQDTKPVRVPQFFFVKDKDVKDKDKDHQQKAVVYAVPTGQLKVEDVSIPDPAYPWQMQIERDENNLGFVYVILYTGKDCHWLKLPPRD